MIAALDLVRAERRLRGHLDPSPLRHSPWLSDQTKASVFLKLECAQLTNSFKIRGAFNAGLRVLEQVGGDPRRAPEIVTASAGNHGRAFALVSEQLGLRTTIFTPRDAPETKKRAIRRHQAILRDDPPDYDAAELAARAYASSHDALFISAYNHPDVIAGAGTVALECLVMLPSVDVIVAPIGGGGLISGVGIAAKAYAPHATVVGVETAASTPFAQSLAAGEIVRIEAGASLADGLTGNLEPNAMTFDIARQVVDRLESVSELEIARAIRELAAEEHVIAEGAGAVATAAVLCRDVVGPGDTVVVLVTGGNIDLDKLAEVIGSSSPR